MTEERKVEITLLLMRVSIAVVFLAWTMNKLLAGERTSKMMSHYYSFDFSQNLLMVLGVLEIAFVLVFLSGKFRKWTYGLVILLHTASTLVSTRRFLPPYESHALLYLTAFPMLAACIALYLLRDKDTLWSLK